MPAKVLKLSPVKSPAKFLWQTGHVYVGSFYVGLARADTEDIVDPAEDIDSLPPPSAGLGECASEDAEGTACHLDPEWHAVVSGVHPMTHSLVPSAMVAPVHLSPPPQSRADLGGGCESGKAGGPVQLILVFWSGIRDHSVRLVDVLFGDQSYGKNAAGDGEMGQDCQYRNGGDAMRFRWMTKPSLRIDRPVVQRKGPRRAFHVLILSAMAVTLNSGTGVVEIGHLILSC
eukprot:3689384-Rhodomonas_salina.1